MLGDLNPDVGETLAGERARLNRHGYPEDLPLPALWWTPRACDELVEVAADLGSSDDVLSPAPYGFSRGYESQLVPQRHKPA